MKMVPRIMINLFIIIACLFLPAQCARILAVSSFPGKSHFQMTSTIIKELTYRGHEVTFVTNFHIEENLSNYTEILISPIHDFWKDAKHLFKTDDLFSLTEMTTDDFNQLVQLIGLTTTDYAMKHPKIQKLLHDTELQFDLLLAEQFYQEAFLALAYKYKVPVVTMTTLGFGNYMSQMMGFITPFSFVPHGYLPFDDHMTLYERFLNAYDSLYEDFDREMIYFPKQDALVRKYFSHLEGPIPSVSKMEKNISVILLNSHIPLTTPRPSVPGMIQIGGVHIKEPKPLPKDIKEFLDGAEHGAIYFSLGTNLRSSDIPPEKLSVLLKVFGSMKQRILWKWEDEQIPQLPKNIMVKKWMPQSDILAHHNVKVFITHGGLFGTQEGVYRAVPMLGIPIYCDQHLNMKKAAKAGYAISLHFPNITEESFSWALSELLYNPTYMQNMQRISTIFRDRPMPALDTAMYWIEYVIRYKGASQIRSAGRDLPWYSFYLLDIAAIVLGVVFTVISIICLLCSALIRSKKGSKKEKHH
ncbi:UDP-glycosyltransferase UGT4-like [Hermetia illucens]|uniref:UDP-glycosyltransferase UGT4-like n=1 Tax=Hermetia illucens TaxID=343691 RepID=UPI0018CC3710|nr:UDP-glycosyltransferase UGT4-like [Hermetia illucens]